VEERTGKFADSWA